EVAFPVLPAVDQRLDVIERPPLADDLLAADVAFAFVAVEYPRADTGRGALIVGFADPFLYGAGHQKLSLTLSASAFAGNSFANSDSRCSASSDVSATSATIRECSSLKRRALRIPSPLAWREGLRMGKVRTVAVMP